MPSNTGREEYQRIANAKFEDAQILANAGRYSNAYYLAGFSVEIALKACIAKQIIAYTIPDKKFINDVHVHDLRKLVGLAGLNAEFQQKQRADELFSAFWGIVADWSVESRYTVCEMMECQLLLNAISDPNSGVLPWIRTVW